MSFSSLTPEIRKAARVLWDYHRLGRPVAPAEGIVVFGSNDVRVAERAADLFHDGIGPWILFSGARGRMTEHWTTTEAEELARVAHENGVPDSAILLEPRATNTGENIRFSRELLTARSLTPLTSLVVVQKPYMERRTLAALEAQWPEIAFQPTSPAIAFDDYCTTELTPQVVIEAMAGDFQRILDYPALGFATTQPVTGEALDAFETLVEAGFAGQLR